MSRVLAKIAYAKSDPLPGVEVVPTQNKIVIDGRSIKLAATKADIAFNLWKAAPTAVSFARLWAEIYDGKPGLKRKENGPRRNTMFQHLYHLKAALKGTRIRIEGSARSGYRMVSA